MSTQITTAFVEQFRQGIDLNVQQMGSRLRNAVRLESGIVGKRAAFDRISATAAVRKTTRHGDTPLIDTPHNRRWVTMLDYEWADLIDDADRLKVMNDPASAYSRNAAMAMGRAMDDEVIAAFLGTSVTGEDATGTVTFANDGGTTIAVAGTGLTVEKLRNAKQVLDANENDPDEERFLACSARQIRDLLEETEVTSSDFNTVKALVQGDVDTFMGFKFIRTERLTTSSGDRQCVAWRKSAMILGLAQDSRARISERDDKSYSTQVFYSMSLGATRAEGEGVVEIVCDEP